MKLEPLRHRLAVILLVAATLFSGYYSYFMDPPRHLVRESGAAKWEERMQPARNALPPGVRQVGYISDNENTALVQEYSLTRYALAPVVVHQNVDHEWIIGNFTDPGFEEILDAQISSEYTVQKFGAGIYLIHRTLP
jgi:hypothetical protein